MMESRSPVVPPGFSPPKRLEVVFVLVPIAGVEPNRPPPVVPAVVGAAGFMVPVVLLKFPNIPPPVAPVLFPNRLPLGTAGLGIPAPAVFNPRTFDVAGAAAPAEGLLTFHVVAAAAGVIVDPVGASRLSNYW